MDDKDVQELRKLNDQLQREVEDLRRSKDVFRLIMDSAWEAVFVAQDGVIKFANHAAIQMTGCTLDELIAKPLTDFIYPDDQQMVMERELRRLKGEQVPPRYTFRTVDKDGEIRWVEINVVESSWEGRPATLNFLSDITEHQRAKDALRQSAELFQCTFASQMDAIFILDASEPPVIQDCNPAAERLFGYGREEMLGRTTAFLHETEKTLAEFQNILYSAVEQHGFLSPTDYRMRRKDGSIFSSEHAVMPLKAENGERIGWVSLVRDISQRRQAEEALQRSEARYRLLAENVDDIIWSTDMDLRLTYISPSIERQSLYTAGEVLSMPMEQLYTPESVEAIRQAFAEEMALEEKGRKRSNVSRTLELKAFRKDGSTSWIEVCATFIRGDDGKPIGIQGVSRIINERKQAEQKLRGAYDRQIKAHRELGAEMKRRVEFTRALIHELKTPVTAMMASNTLLVEELPEGPLLRLAENVQQSIANLDKRIGELLDIARGELGLLKLKRREVNPLIMLHATVAEMDAEISNRGQYLVTDLPRRLPRAWIDEERLREVVLNLLGNASKLSPKGETITLGARRDKDSLIVEVKDNGPGVARKDTEKIFEPYYRVESDRQRLPGLGLGLALCKRIVENHGGKIWVKSQKGKGSTFVFSIPLKEKDQLKAEIQRKDDE